MLDRNGYIYYIHCVKNNKTYIGSTCREARFRRNEHFSRLKYKKHGNSHLQNAYNKYGKSSMRFGIIEECHIDSLFILESHYVEIMGTYNKYIGFNKSKVVKAPHTGTKMSQEIKDKISKTLKGRTSPMKGRKNPIASIQIKKMHKLNMKKVIELNTGIIFESVKSFTTFYNMSRNTFCKYVGKASYKKLNFDYYKGGKLGSHL